MALRDSKDYIRALLYSYHTTISEWGSSEGLQIAGQLCFGFLMLRQKTHGGACGGFNAKCLRSCLAGREWGNETEIIMGPYFKGFCRDVYKEPVTPHPSLSAPVRCRTSRVQLGAGSLGFGRFRGLGSRFLGFKVLVLVHFRVWGLGLRGLGFRVTCLKVK